MPIGIVTGIDAEAAQRAHENQVQFAVGEQGACAHTVAHAVGEHGGVGLLEPAFWSEFLRVGPYFGIWGLLATFFFFFFL